MAIRASTDDRSLLPTGVSAKPLACRGYPLGDAAAIDLRRNVFVAWHLGGALQRRPRPTRVTVGTSSIALTLALALLATPSAAVDHLVAVIAVGLAAARSAATLARPHPSWVGPRPANDNPPRPVLPPHLLRC